MLVVLAVGILLCGAGVVLLINLFGAGDAVMARVTTRPLGELAPGFAATRSGFRIYAVLLISLGAAALGVALENALVIVLGLVGFVVASAVAIAGEVRTYRALKR